ncbi:uncharacterized protein A4U43_C05F22180 [Asparagus officinalis]|uniref:Virilizer N-terminal domain-containing protein n=1 Tax=Asparagus officinalis TaxID=4686 RepID=A0A5P1EUX9_ASPOF|nr:uncharacterized protein LOC109840229 [Asparagus officinalis]XP_020264380.1 uncharacterized protein LOC109840229 [Asparagus officinalis]ONK69373.1 uncharacterized protein A4U43_C05F22180 [Asparagus officinalis]
MGRRPEPCILFAQTFVHPQLDEYVDEVLFAEPIVVTACEFLEQNATVSTPSVSLVGATSPPSFAMEVFVHCEGESRFRRLCQPFLYSHSSSNVLEVEAVITNHLVVRGCYRSLTLIIYGNTAEDLGQFNIEFDLDNSLVSVAPSPSEGRLEDLPPALLSEKITFEESILSTKCFSLPVPDLDLSSEMKQFLRLTLSICQISDDVDTIHKVARPVVSAICSYITSDYKCMVFNGDQLKPGYADRKKDPQKIVSVLAEAKNELVQLYESLQLLPGNEHMLTEDIIFEPVSDLMTSQLLVDMLFHCFPSLLKPTSIDLHAPFQNEILILGLSTILLLCTSRESCFHFVNCGGMKQLAALLGHMLHGSTAFTLVLLGALENATQHAIGCEGFLGWWPRVDENVPSAKSEGYSNLLNLLLTKQRHVVASLATCILQRLRLYESASRYECAVLSTMASSAEDGLTTDKIDLLLSASSHLKQIVKLLNLCGPIEDPSPAAFTRRSMLPVTSDGLLSYRTTASYISLSKYSFSKWDINTHLLSLLMERGFFPLSAALLSSPLLHSVNGSRTDIFVDIATSIQSLLLSLLSCRSGLTFLLLQPEATATLVLSLQGAEGKCTAECLTLRQAAILMSKGFFCHPQEIAMIMEIHLRVGNAIDRLLTITPHSDELLWVLWDLCTISRSECGRQALLSLCYFPEALSVLIEALHSFKDLEKIATDDGASPLSLATFHSAAEIFEVIVTDSTASSLNSWIGHAVDLHKALHLSSPGSNRKDAPTRLLEWIDAGVVYHRNGVVGLLRYAAILASGGDAHLSSTSVLVSESMDVENVVGDSTNASDTQILDSLLGKLVSDKYFDGVTLGSSSIVQLTTAVRILSFISENSAMSASLFEEGAMTLVYVVLINCKYMLEQSSNTYDYLVDEGAECNSTSELLLERINEQNLVDLMIPSLALLINLLRKLHNTKTKEPYRNKKLVNALLGLHREVSPKLAACATDYSSAYPSLVLGFGAVCHLIASALAYWGVCNWTPGLFHCLLGSVPASASLALGPKDACSMLHLLAGLLPDEGIWLWCDGMPPLCALKTLSIGTILGPEAEGYIDWFLQPDYLNMLLVKLTSQLSRIGHIILNFAFSTLVVIQDMLRVFIIRIACQRPEYADVLLQPLILWIKNHMSETSLSEVDSFKVYRLLTFLASLLEHPRAKILLCKADTIRTLVNVVKRCNDAYSSGSELVLENRVPGKIVSSLLSWSIPVFKSLALIFDPRTSVPYSEKYGIDDISIEVSTTIGRQLLRSCQVLPVGKELLACLLTLKEFTCSFQGRTALFSIFRKYQPSARQDHGETEKELDMNIPDECNWRQFPPFLCCWKMLSGYLNSRDDSMNYIIEAVYALTLSALHLSIGSESLEGISMIKFLFGLPYGQDVTSMPPDGMLKDVLELLTLLNDRTADDSLPALRINLLKAKESVKSLLLLLQGSSIPFSKSEDLTSREGSCTLSHEDYEQTASQLMLTETLCSSDDETSFSHIWKSIENAESDNSIFPIGSLGDKFMWECPDTSPDRQLMAAPPGKRKMASTEISGKRVRESPGSEVVGSNAFSRGLSTPAISSAPSRRDTFRQRKPNTSRPPSMHVDDYVARERNIDGVSGGSHVISSSQRGGSTSGRPPSVHVDEFEARQRERQNPTYVTVGEKPQQLKADLDDDLHEIDIVFDEESGSDDKLPFPHPDDNLQSASVVVGESSPGSVVEETEGNANEDSLAFEDVDSHPKTPLERSGSSQQDIPKEGSISSEKNHRVSSMDKKAFFSQQCEEPKSVPPVLISERHDGLTPGNLNPLPPHPLNVSSTASMQQMPPPTFHQRDSPKRVNTSLGSGSQGYYGHKFTSTQPPLPPTPPPSISITSLQTTESIHGISSHHVQRDTQTPPFPGYPFQSFNASGAMGLHVQSGSLSSTVNSPQVSLMNAQLVSDNKYLWNTDSPGSRLQVENYTSGGSRPLPPLPPTPPPFSTPMAQSSLPSSGSQSSLHAQIISSGSQLSSLSASINDSQLGTFSASGPTLTSFSLPPFSPSLLISRPPVSGNIFSSPMQQHGQIPSNISLSMPSPQHPLQSVQSQPPPPPPPQPPRPHPSQNLGFPIQMPQPQFEQVLPMQQNSVQVQMQPLQMQQQIHIPQIQLLYQQHQQEHLPQPPQPPLAQTQQNLQADNDPGITLQQFFSSPEAIQSLLSDRDKLCQLLEQHPKLMQMLQERLGQM